MILLSYARSMEGIASLCQVHHWYITVLLRLRRTHLLSSSERDYWLVVRPFCQRYALDIRARQWLKYDNNVRHGD